MVNEGIFLLKAMVSLYYILAFQPIAYKQSVCCVTSTLTFGLGYGHCFGIPSTVDLCRICVLSLRGWWNVLDNKHGKESSELC